MGEHAPVWDLEVEAFNMAQSQKIVSIKKERLKRESAKKVARKQIKTLLVSMIIVLFFAFVFGTIIYRNSLVNEAKYDIFNLKSEIKSLNAQIEELNASIENQTELSYVEKVAKESLNMQYPTKSQIVYIDSGVQYALADSAAEIAAKTTATPEETNSNDESLVIRARDFMSALFKLN